MTREELSRVIMVQGTTSHAGKSVMAAALCRIFAQDGLRVAPFKAQNMSLNSFATPDGGEIGRAQAVQAEAAMVAPTVDMNPILLKPEGQGRSQVVVMGEPETSASAQGYYKMKSQLWPIVTGALDRLRGEFEVVVIEGAGSPAEINLREHEIVNMRVATYAQAPVLLVADIDRGGVFASIVGTMELLQPQERALIEGFIINKFRGDPSLLDSGLDMLLERTGVPVLGVLPYFTHIHLPEEDSLGLRGGEESHSRVLDIAVIRLPHIANFDDFDPLKREDAVGLRYVSKGDELGEPDLIIIPGSKTTMDDLQWLKEGGLEGQLLARRSKGVPVIGICAGFQMLGARIADPQGVESSGKLIQGLGLLPITTCFQQRKATQQVEATVRRGHGLLTDCSGAGLKGYEIHMGETEIEGASAPFTVTLRSGQAVDGAEGAMDAEGLVLGTYLHGLFHNDDLRRGLLGWLAARKGATLPPSSLTMDSGKEFDELAALVRGHLDMAAVYRMTGLEELLQ